MLWPLRAPNVSGIFVPPAFAADAIMESAAAGIELTVCITEGIPVHDMIRARDFVLRTGHRPPRRELPGDRHPRSVQDRHHPQPHQHARPGRDRRRSGTLTYEVIQGLGQAGMGQTTSVGIGGDPVMGLSFPDVLQLFADDAETRAVVLIGEIGGSDEETAAAWIRDTGFDKPVVAFISGRTAPPGKRMGHAGAIISGNTGSAQSKLDALTAAGAEIADTIEDVVRLTAARLGTHPR